MPPQELVTGNDFFNLGGSLPRLPTGMPHPMLAGGWMPPPPGNSFVIYLDKLILLFILIYLVLYPIISLFASRRDGGSLPPTGSGSGRGADADARNGHATRYDAAGRDEELRAGPLPLSRPDAYGRQRRRRTRRTVQADLKTRETFARVLRVYKIVPYYNIVAFFDVFSVFEIVCFATRWEEKERGVF